MAEIFIVTAGYVDVPPDHRPFVPGRIPFAAGEPLPHGFRIQGARECPQFAYRVMHRGFRFYLKDADVPSRLILEALVSTYTSRMGGVSRRSVVPELVIQIG